MAAGSSLIVISNRWDLECDDGVQSSWQQDCQRQWWLHWIWLKTPRLPFTLSRNEEGVLIRKAAAGEMLDHWSLINLTAWSTSVSRLMKIYWAPNQNKFRIGNTEKCWESAIRSNFLWTRFRESPPKGRRPRFDRKKITNYFFTFGNVWNILWILCQVALSLPWHQWSSRLDLQQRWYKPTWRYERWTKPTWRYSWWVKQHDLNNINIFASVDILWDRH